MAQAAPLQPPPKQYDQKQLMDWFMSIYNYLRRTDRVATSAETVASTGQTAAQVASAITAAIASRQTDKFITTGVSNVYALTATPVASDEFGFYITVEGAPQDPDGGYTWDHAGHITIPGEIIPAGFKVYITYNKAV